MKYKFFALTTVISWLAVVACIIYAFICIWDFKAHNVQVLLTALLIAIVAHKLSDALE